ncbi:MAG: hypothetical protein WD398_14400 [Cyclobacteriaceae bacterium]
MHSKLEVNMAFPEEFVTAHYYNHLPIGFDKVVMDPKLGQKNKGNLMPKLYTAHLPQILNWLHELDQPRIWENEPCEIPILLFDKEISFESLLFHYDGTPASAALIHHFLSLFSENIRNSKATIISPAFISRSKQKEEQELIRSVSAYTAETSFIKFNFNRIGDFWSYAVKHQCTLLVTAKKNQADLAKVLFHFYKGGMWYARLSFYLSI